MIFDVRILLTDKRINVNAIGIFGRTALIFAAYNDCQEIFEMLLKDERVDVNVVDHNLQSALVIARKFGHSEIVQMFEFYQKNDHADI